MSNITAQGLMDHINGLAEAKPMAGLGDFEHLRITAENEYPNSSPLGTWNGSGIIAPRNQTWVSAQAKAGKTAFESFLIAGCISVDGLADIPAALEIVPNNEKKAVIHMDTEQDRADQQYNIRTILKRTGCSITPDHYLSYNILQLPLTEYIKTTDAICAAASEKHGGIYCIFIDGIADYMEDTNNITQSRAIREYFTLLANKYDCPVVAIIHQNPGSEKERGHIGGEGQRKCYAMISITKDGDISCAKNKFSRKAGELEPIYFKYDTDKGYHVEIDAPDKGGAAGTEKKKKAIHNCLVASMKPLEAYKHKELVELVMGMTACSEITAKRYIGVAVVNEWVQKGEDDRYRLINSVSGISRYQSVSN
ncbi:MAG: hypothetical protein J7539_13305 [Niabella sp.]|nr:hypothetical protein [Niabella sp.]